jgi:hypothetical protein
MQQSYNFNQTKADIKREIRKLSSKAKREKKGVQQ